MARERFHNDLKPYAVLWAGVLAEIENQTDDELVALAESCTKPTGTNCWFATMHAAQWIAPLVADEIARRKMVPNVQYTPWQVYIYVG